MPPGSECSSAMLLLHNNRRPQADFPSAYRPRRIGWRLRDARRGREHPRPNRFMSTRPKSTMARGGKRPSAGGPPGAISKSTRAILEATAAGGEMPLEYMLRIMRGSREPAARRRRDGKGAAIALARPIGGDRPAGTNA